VVTLGGGIVFTPIATALTVVAFPRTRPETLVDFGALLVGAAAVAFYTLMFVWTVGLVLYECCSQPPRELATFLAIRWLSPQSKSCAPGQAAIERSRVEK
jgi:hypothetical protein